MPPRCSSAPVRLTEDGIESTLAGPFLLTSMLLPELIHAAPARIVNVGSHMHIPNSGRGVEVDWDWDNLEGQKTFEPVGFYKNSKLAVMWLPMS